jgi:hypothetical protein
MKKTMLAAMGLVVLAGCSSAASTSSYGDNGTPAPSGGDDPSTGSGGFAASGGSSSGSTSGGSAASPSTSGSTSSTNNGGQAGILTAGLWDDHANFDIFTGFVSANGQIAGNPAFSSAELAAAHTKFAQRPQHTRVDAAIVMDTTGSMGDEITYLTSEFAAISSAISAKFPNADQRWALVLYRDRPDTDPGDEYIVKSIDFTSDMSAFASSIGAQSAGGGGDYQEAPELGLGEVPKLTWRTDADVAKLAFWVGDAPQHDERGPDMKQSIQGVAQSDVHLYPVSASGTDQLLELTMRSAAEITGGRYLFLTDDSGVGDPHKKPEIPCYYVTKLERALVRAVTMELSGQYLPPAQSDVIRAVGSPMADGTCAEIAPQTTTKQ